MRGHEFFDLRVQHTERERRVLSRAVRDKKLYDLQHVHGGEVKGDMRLGVGAPADPVIQLLT
jgi:hypothetical protein